MASRVEDLPNSRRQRHGQLNTFRQGMLMLQLSGRKQGKYLLDKN